MKAKIALLVAIVLGFVAAWAVSQYVKQQKMAAFDLTKPVDIIVAAREIQAGEAITGPAIKGEPWALKYLPAQSITWNETNKVVTRKVNRRVKRGEPVLWSDLVEADKEKEKGLQGLLAVGERGYTISLNRVSGVGGHIRPGDRVDIYTVVAKFRDLDAEPRLGPSAFDLREVDKEIQEATQALAQARSANNQPLVNELLRRIQTLETQRTTVLRSWHLEGEAVTSRLLSSVEVLATDESLEIKDVPQTDRRGMAKQGYSSVTLRLTPMEVSLLISAESQKATFIATLRRRDDVVDVDPLLPVHKENFWDVQKQAQDDRKSRLEKLMEKGGEPGGDAPSP
jgi:Flp pilus assembly protein CpaB